MSPSSLANSSLLPTQDISPPISFPFLPVDGQWDPIRLPYYFPLPFPFFFFYRDPEVFAHDTYTLLFLSLSWRA